MRYLPETASLLEVWWIFGALLGMIGTGWTIGIYGRACIALVREIRQGRASYTGPRWAYTFGTFTLMFPFLYGWMAFLLTGLIAALLPERPTAIEVSTTEILFEALIVSGEIFIALGQAGIVVVWWMVRRAVIFVPIRRTRFETQFGVVEPVQTEE